MAEQADGEVCSICLNDFEQPVIIDCQHSFCFICLEDYVNKTSTQDQFQCPLCRCLIQIPTGGVNQLRHKPNIDDNSVNNIPQCDICTEDTSQYFCQDCDQYLCKSCKTMHHKLKSCKDHVVCRYDENQIVQQSMSNGIKKERTQVTNHKDFCTHHEQKKVTIYCKDCSLAMCLKCFVANHNGHNYFDLQEDEVRQNIRTDLTKLNDELETQVTRLQKHYDNLSSKLTEVKNFTKTECDKVDAHVVIICSEFRKIGENIKKEIQKTGEEEESKFGNLMEDIKRLTEDLKASVKYSVNVLEDTSIVQVLQRLPKVRKEKDESSCRKLDIPDVRFATFQETEIDKNLLASQLGKILSCHQNMFEDTYVDSMRDDIPDARYSCFQIAEIDQTLFTNQLGYPNMFEDIFNVDTVRDDGWCSGKQYVVSGVPCLIRVLTHSQSLLVILYLYGIEDQIIMSYQVDVTCKIMNITDDRQSVVKEYNGYVIPGYAALLFTGLIDQEILGNPGSGFIDDDRNFTIQVTINGLTDIESGDESDYSYSD